MCEKRFPKFLVNTRLRLVPFKNGFKQHVQQYDGGILHGIIMLTIYYYHRGIRLNTIKRFSLDSLCSHLNVLTISPCLGDAQKVRCVEILL